MLPIPKHLSGILSSINEESDEFHVSGSIFCSCGCKDFYVKIYADIKNGYPQVCKYNEDYALVIKAVCKDCAKDHLIFDDSKHGWNGFVCHEGVTVPDEKLKNWNCPKCKSDIYNINLSINSHGKQDFIDELELEDGETDFTEDEWIEAFDWITIDLKCLSCAYDDKKWIDYETM